MNGRSFRILSLDGGGIRGAYTAAVLASIEEASKKRLVDHFDLIVGTSTGAILAVALGLGVSAANLLEFYLQEGPRIFPSRRWLDRARGSLRWLIGPKHRRGPLEGALRGVLGTRLLGESQCRLAIPAYDVVSNNVYVFKTAHQERFREDYKRLAVEIVLATAAAPTYFDAVTSAKGELLVDGGVWANCPSMVGIAEALDLGVNLSDLRLLSIGTLSEARSFGRAARAGGALHYRLGVLALLTDAQARGAWAQTKLLLKDRAIRINRPVAAEVYALDDPRGLKDLVAYGRYDGRHQAETIIREFLDEPAETFSPLWQVASRGAEVETTRPDQKPSF
jgi:patatin-like phospholipase/acyl hydrolase